ncbi:CDP-diacylglycerol---serine O-phosphatidyltransferase [Lachnospiraceae bacterium C7]|nr:CDP-diacylglycerol---serine O-phosphatidyltransferase [Lachnospiraceae bacterium C7]
MIGFYDYTVILTYVSLICTSFGIVQAVEGNFTIAVYCLAASGLCDMFDGKVARSKKDRTSDEKLFGVQIDSLCDVICFGVFPSVLCYRMGMNGLLGSIAIAYYLVCSVIRLAYFNVLETNRQQVEEGVNKYYHGLPITSISIFLPIVYLFSLHFVPFGAWGYVLFALLFIVGSLFVIDFRLKKPTNRQLASFVALVAVALVITVVVPHKGNSKKQYANGKVFSTIFKLDNNTTSK